MRTSIYIRYNIKQIRNKKANSSKKNSSKHKQQQREQSRVQPSTFHLPFIPYGKPSSVS